MRGITALRAECDLMRIKQSTTKPYEGRLINVHELERLRHSSSICKCCAIGPWERSTESSPWEFQDSSHRRNFKMNAVLNTLSGCSSTTASRLDSNNSSSCRQASNDRTHRLDGSVVCFPTHHAPRPRTPCPNCCSDSELPWSDMRADSKVGMQRCVIH